VSLRATPRRPAATTAEEAYEHAAELAEDWAALAERVVTGPDRTVRAATARQVAREIRKVAAIAKARVR
jgi:hypothetical protein